MFFSFGNDTPAPPATSKNGVYDYDLLVIGGGSGGLAASKEAAKADKALRVGVFDYITPTAHGTTWGLGGTCVNVGCIPKKLFHHAGVAGKSIEDFAALGWTKFEKKHDWNTMVENVDNYIRGLNYGYENALRDEGVTYINALATFTDPHTVSYTENGQQKTLTSEKFLIAVGGRPKFPNIPGAELALSSDDIFWWTKAPEGKTLVVGASYIALECAGFLHETGHDVSVAVRSIPLRGFDSQCAVQICEVMEREGVRFLNPCVPTALERKAGANGPITVTLNVDGKTVTEEYNTVLMAIGRDPLTSKLGLETTGVELNRKGKILVDNKEQTTVPHIFAIGDVIATANGDIRPELTPVAIQQGQLLARRLYKGATRLMDYDHIPTTVFTPLEYGTVGLSQEEAEKRLGAQNVEVYATRFGVLETAVAYRLEIPIPRSEVFTGKNLFDRQYHLKNGLSWEDYDTEMYEYEERARKYIKQPCLAKLVCDRKTNKVLGFHYIGPNAGEITQGYALALKAGVTKEDFDDLVGIHPTMAEEFTTLTTTLSSGESFMKKGGC